MSTYLSGAELADLIGCAPTSFACMRRYLMNNNWPFEPNLRGFPMVSREYHDTRMSGALTQAALQDLACEPDFSMFAS